MTTVIVGAGPVGLVCGLGLAQRGEDVLLVDPDPGPGPDGSWRRKGVMQFRHPHFYRPFVRHVLEQHVPQMWEAVLAAGAVVNDPPEGMPPFMTTIAARREVLEGALRKAASHDRITHVPMRADRVLIQGDRVVGVVVNGTTIDADRVVVATGRTSTFADDLRPPAVGMPCGQSYVSRMYRARPGVDPLVSWAPVGALYDGYLAIAFPQDDGTLSALVVRPRDDDGWSALWSTAGYEAAVARIPNLAPWTDPERFEPITDVMRGGTLLNSYRGQGSPPAGVFFAGDAVSTTNPSAGRGVSLGLLQAAALLDLLQEHSDARDVSTAFDAWCDERVRPWYEDHVATDASLVRSYSGQDIDVEAPLTSDVICAAAEVDPSLAPAVRAYRGMVAPPASLRAVEEQVRDLLRTGWRPAFADGPSRDELLEQMSLATV